MSGDTVGGEIIEGLTEAVDMAKLMKENKRLRAALAPFASFAEAHYNPEIGLKSDLGPDYVWLCPSPGYPKITTQCFVEARTALGSVIGQSEPEPGDQEKP